MNITIRFAKINDLDDLMSIENLVQLSPWSEALMRQRIMNEKIIVTEREGLVVGYGVFEVVLDEAEILNLAVAKVDQSKGVGSELLRWTIDYLKKQRVKNIFLEVRRSNQNAITLYENTGFKLISVRKDYYRTSGYREDALIYQHNDGLD